MRTTLLPLLLLLAATSCRSSGGTDKNQPTADSIRQPARTPAPAKVVTDLPSALSVIVPAGYEVLDTASGDLNLDQYADMVMVLRKTGEETDGDKAGEQRPVLLLLGQSDGSYKLAKRNDHVVLCSHCGPGNTDPYSGIAIKHGYFSIEHGMTGGSPQVKIITFKYDKGRADWLLHQDGAIRYKFNDSTDDYAEALELDKEDIRRKKDFGLVPFEEYRVESGNAAVK